MMGWFSGCCGFSGLGGFGSFGWIGLIFNLAIIVIVISFPREILDIRYARGEIDRDLYQQMVSDLN